MIYFVVHGCVDVHDGVVVIVGLYRLLLLLLFRDFIFEMIYDLHLFDLWD